MCPRRKPQLVREQEATERAHIPCVLRTGGKNYGSFPKRILMR